MAGPTKKWIQMRPNRQRDVLIPRVDGDGNPVMRRVRDAQGNLVAGPGVQVIDKQALFPGQSYELPEGIARAVINDGDAVEGKQPEIKWRAADVMQRAADLAAARDAAAMKQLAS